MSNVDVNTKRSKSLNDHREETLEEFCEEIKRQKPEKPEHASVTHQQELRG